MAFDLPIVRRRNDRRRHHDTDRMMLIGAIMPGMRVLLYLLSSAQLTVTKVKN